MALHAGDPAPDLSALDANGEPVSLSQYRGRWVVLVFLRWLGWLHWQDHLAQLRQRQSELAASDAVVLVISFDPPRRVRGYCRRFAQPFTCLSDEPRAAYRAFGLGRASWLRTLTPRALAPYVRLIFSPSRAQLGRAAENDLRQMGGDFVVAPDGLLTLAYASHDPADRPSADTIVAALG